MIPHHFSMFYVYVLRSKKTGEMYIGVTNNVDRRLEQHNAGDSYWTKSRRPFEMVYYEAYLSREDALQREKKLKKFKNSFKHLKNRIENSMYQLSKSGGG